MAVYKNKAGQKLTVYAYDNISNLPKTGDASNITVYLSKDGGPPVAVDDTSLTELSSTNAPGVYILDLTQEETNADLMIITASSSTSNVQLDPGEYTTEPEQRSATVSDITATALAKFASTDTGETDTVAGSVARLSQGAGGGSGTVQYAYSIDDGSGNPVIGATVWCTTDQAGTNRVQTTTTGTDGIALFDLDPGGYYFWATASGYSSIRADYKTVN